MKPRMQVVGSVCWRLFFVLTTAFLLVFALDARGAPVPPRTAPRDAERSPCDTDRDRCRAACFDRHAGSDEAAYARCREACNQVWLACTARR